MFVGVLLGDAHIRKVGLDKAYITFEQSKDKVGYINYLHQLASEGGYKVGDIREYNRIRKTALLPMLTQGKDSSTLDNNTESLNIKTDTIDPLKLSEVLAQKKTESLYFRTESSTELRPLADAFLSSEGKKVVPSNIADMLTLRGLAFWIMDDGQQVKKGGVTLCTDSFGSDEVSLLREVLSSKFDLSTSIHRKTSKDKSSIYERIYIKKESLDEIKPELKPHMHESMYYKIHE